MSGTGWRAGPSQKDAVAGWQKLASNLQSRWREGRGYAMGYRAPSYAPVDSHGHTVDTIGSCLTAEDGDLGRNFLTATMAGEACRAVAAKEHDAVIEVKRLRRNLLSSQPLCFNLFGELSAGGQQDLATDVVRRLWPDITGRVTGIRYEHNPHRGPFGLIGTKSAFDVFIDVVDADGALSFVGIEVKYHEDMREDPLSLTKQDPIEEEARKEALRGAAQRIHGDLEAMCTSGVAQIWLDHSLALAMLDADVQAAHHSCQGRPCLPAYTQGRFVMLAPRANGKVTTAYTTYRELLARQDADLDTLDYLALDDFIDACTAADPSVDWPHDIRQRYLGTAT